MPVIHLRDRALIEVSGEAAESFLQNVVTTDLASVDDGGVRPGALLTPQGKILFDFLISRLGRQALRLECRGEVADDFARRLALYRLRAKADIARRDLQAVAVCWRAGSDPAEEDPAWLRDLRFAEPVWRRYEAPLPAQDRPAEDWRAFRISCGIAESGEDYALGEAFPHDVLLDQIGGVGFAKGCYVGQEVVSRMQHRGTARRRILIARGERPLPPPGTAVSAGGRQIGALGSTAGETGLALVRIDRVKAALDAGETIAAGGAPLALSIPEWARFGFPETASASADA